jgi:hypothetical protein|tara:strand:+ start:3865 stop:4194 length:330 start_codon:yes stop_codon:yes gene_type:complete
MAQDFELALVADIGTGTTLYNNGDSDDALIGIRFANIHDSASITVDCWIARGGADYYLIKNAPVPFGGSLELIDGGSKINLLSGDHLKATCNTASSCDVAISRVDAIST